MAAPENAAAEAFLKSPTQTPLQPPWRIAVDTGGTFTDLVLADAEGRIWPVKSPSVPSDPAEGVIRAVALVAGQLGLSVSDLLGSCAQFIHGSTVATNTILEGKGAAVGLITTAGFRDALEIRRGLRGNPWDHRTPYPPVMVPRSRRIGIAGRIAEDGTELEPLDREAARAAILTLRDKGCEAIAVGLLNSYANPAHEEAVAEIAGECWPGAWVTLGARVAPLIGDYERSSTAVVDAAVAPRIVPYLTRLAERLEAGGLRSRLLLMQSNGGMLTVDQVRARPVALVLSGPAAGVGALEYFAAAHAGVTAGAASDMLTMEIGGTSCDVILMSAGRVETTDLIEVGGYHVLTPSVEIHTVSAGGGTIARVDEGGLLEMGPHGAGARPGPACYGLGGERPTVTDAQLVLGRLKPGPYAGGAVSLDLVLAETALGDHVAGPLGLPLDEAALGALEVTEQHLLHAVERISVERGHDPGRFVLVAVGGAGPMHGASVARRLGCRGAYIPRLAGVFCALGMLNSDVRHDFVRTVMSRLGPGSFETLAPLWSELEGAGQAVLAEEGFGPERCRIRRELDLRHPGQQWPLPVAVPPDATEESLRESFEAAYERLYGHRQSEAAVEIVTARIVATGVADRLPVRWSEPADGPPPEPDRRPIVFRRGEAPRETAIYRGAELRPGHSVDGPALVEELTTTVLVGPGERLRVDAADNFVIEFARGA